MIVIAELDAGLLAGFAGFIKEFGSALPAVRFFALLFINPRTNNVAVADDFRGLESLGPLFLDDVIIDMARRRCQAILVEDRANVLRGMVKVSGEFDFLLACGGDFRDSAFEVGFHGIAYGVELQADAINAMRGPDRVGAGWMCGFRSPGWLGGGCESCGDGCTDKCSSIHAPHFTPSGKKGHRES